MFAFRKKKWKKGSLNLNILLMRQKKYGYLVESYPVGEPWEAEPFGLVNCEPHDAGKLTERTNK